MIRLPRFLRREDGAATVQFVVLVPALMMVLANTVEGAVVLTRSAFLDRALDEGIRELRIGAQGPMSFDTFRGLICDNAVGIPDCENAVRIELRQMSAANMAAMETATECRDRSQPIVPRVELAQGGSSNDIMLVRLCASYTPSFPGVGVGAMLPKDGNGDYRITALSAYVREP